MTSRVVSRNLQEVEGVVEACPGVQVRAKGAAEGLKIVDDLLLGKALSAVERHVFHVVRKPPLVLLLVNGAGPDHQRRCAPGRCGSSLCLM